MQKITIILPVHNEAAIIESTITAVRNIFTNLSYQPIFLIIDDGSTDETWTIIKHLAQTVPDTKGLSFSRNFGKERAIFAGIQNTTTELAVVMDSDLQHPPEVIPKLLTKWEETGCHVVHAVKTGREFENSRNRFYVELFYRLYGWCAATDLSGASDFKLLTRPALDAYRSLNEQQLFFRGLVPWLGFHQEAIPFTVAQRTTGHSKWNFTNRLLTALNAITSFSTVPLHLITIVGTLFLLGAAGLTLYTLYEWIRGNSPAGFTTIIILLLIIGSALMISLGIIGQYLSHIYNEVKQRPPYLIKDRTE